MFDQASLFLLVLAGAAILLVVCPACTLMSPSSAPEESLSLHTFDGTLTLLENYTNAVLLTTSSGEGRLVVAPDYAGRVMMAGWTGEEAPRLGWVNAPVVTGREINPAFINYGGAERLWLSPEAGQFGLFFKPGDPFDLDHWMTPTTFNSEPFEVLFKNSHLISLGRDMRLNNYQGTPFRFRVLRSIRLINRVDLLNTHAIALSHRSRFVGYETTNELINRGFSKMTMQDGLVSLWILSQFDANPDTWVLFPFKSAAEGGQEPYVKADYFGAVPPERLMVEPNLGCALFHCDGRRRTKIGLSQSNTRNAIGSMDFRRNILTVMLFNLPERATFYANNSWEIQKEPYKGDVVNSYNNGPEGVDADVPECFYELETLSTVKELAPGHRLEHVSTVLHFTAPFDELNEISKSLLAVDLEAVRNLIQPQGGFVLTPEARKAIQAPSRLPSRKSGDRLLPTR